MLRVSFTDPPFKYENHWQMVFVDKHTVNTRDELSGVDVMTLPEAQEASEQWQSASNYSTYWSLLYTSRKNCNVDTDLYLSGNDVMTLLKAQEALK